MWGHVGMSGASLVTQLKNLPASAGDAVSIPWSERSGKRHGSPVFLGRRAWQAIVHGVTKESDMTWQLNNYNNRAWVVLE